MTLKLLLTTPQAKALGLKAAGTSKIVLGRLGVRDRDGDLLEKGFVANSGDEVPVSIWNHSLIKEPGSKRAGVGIVKEEGEEVVAYITWDDTPEGKATCKRVDEERPDWSWGFPEPETREPTKEEKAQGIKRVIKSVPVLELSPVDQGAGIAQGTLETCCGSCKSAASCSHKGAPKLDAALGCKCAGSCACGAGAKGGDDDLVDPPSESLLDRLRLARLGAGRKESDSDRSRRLELELVKAFGQDGMSLWVDDVFSDEKAVVYSLTPQQGGTRELFRVTYEEGEDGALTFGEPVAVRRTTSYAPAATA
jgi:hypothetical protein